jgi:DNA-binding MarR family transcriptional regulator
MTRYPTREERTQRAFQAYADLLDTAEWMKGQLRGPLASFDLAIGDFRLMELLYREGALFASDVARRRGLHRQALDATVARLEKFGWVKHRMVRLPPVEFERTHWAKALSRIPRVGRRAKVVGLTRAGKKFIGNVLPRHSKLVKAFMRALNGTEQESLSRLCRKLREGDVLKFVSELMHEDGED